MKNFTGQVAAKSVLCAGSYTKGVSSWGRRSLTKDPIWWIGGSDSADMRRIMA